MSVKKRILDLVGERITDKEWLGQERNVELREIMSEKGFYLQRGQDSYRHFMKYKLDKNELQLASGKIQSIPRQKKWIEKIRKELFNAKYSFNKNDKFAENINTLITYLDKNAKGRAHLNGYKKSPRNVARAMVRQNDWYKQFVKHRLDEYEERSPCVQNAINYIKDPMSQVSMVCVTHRIRFSKKVLETVYDSNKFTGQIKEMFSPYKNYVNNKQNFTIFCIRWLYDKDIKRIWQ